MILASDVYDTVLDLARKDARGRSLSVEEFNTAARVVNELVFQKYYADFEDTLETSEAMSGFKVIGEAVAVGAGGIVTLPTLYYNMVGMPYYLSGSTYRYLDMVSSLEHAKREQDYLTKGTLTHPTFRFGIANTTASMTMYVTPSSGITTVYLDYIRVPYVPFLDYYVNDTTAVYTYMADTAVAVAVPSGSRAPQVVQNNVTLRAETTGAANVTSYTENFEWDDSDLPLIVDLFLQQLGISLPSPELYEGGTLGEQKLGNL